MFLMNLISTLHLKQNNMEQKDLRIGDKIVYEGEVYKIVEIGKSLLNIVKGIMNIICDISEIKPIPITDDLLLKLGFDKHDCSDLGLDIEYELATLKGFISVSNVSNSKGKDYSVQIDNLAHTSVGGMDIACLHELQHIVWDCLKVELKIEL